MKTTPTSLKKVRDLRFGEDIRKWATLPLPNTDARRQIMNQGHLEAYQAQYGHHTAKMEATRWGLEWVVPAFEAGRAKAIAGKARELAKMGTTE